MCYAFLCMLMNYPTFCSLCSIWLKNVKKAPYRVFQRTFFIFSWLYITSLFSANATMFYIYIFFCPQKVFFLCSPDCPKQPRTSFPFYKFFYPIVSAKVSGLNHGSYLKISQLYSDALLSRKNSILK